MGCVITDDDDDDVNDMSTLHTKNVFIHHPLFPFFIFSTPFFHPAASSSFESSSMNAKKWEVELSTLKSNNSRPTAALQESTANVEEWKRQLQAYKEENQRLKQRALEAEAAKGDSDAAAEIRKELAILREKVDFYNQALKGKEDEIRMLKESTKEFNNNDSVKVRTK